MKLRIASMSDLPSVEAIARAAYGLYVSRIGRDPAPMIADFAAQIEQAIVHVAIDHQTVCGFIVLYPRDDHVHVENVAVDPERQGLGIGGLMLDFATDFARGHDLRALELYTNAKMTENLTYYPKLGFMEIGRRVEDGFSRVYFRKVLA